jgi:hypothetical protein
MFTHLDEFFNKTKDGAAAVVPICAALEAELGCEDIN